MQSKIVLVSNVPIHEHYEKVHLGSLARSNKFLEGAKLMIKFKTIYYCNKVQLEIAFLETDKFSNNFPQISYMYPKVFLLQKLQHSTVLNIVSNAKFEYVTISCLDFLSKFERYIRKCKFKNFFGSCKLK